MKTKLQVIQEKRGLVTKKRKKKFSRLINTGKLEQYYEQRLINKLRKAGQEIKINPGLKARIKGKFIHLNFTPERDIKDALRVIFDRGTATETKLAVTDIKKGQTKYELPQDGRRVIKVFVKK